MKDKVYDAVKFSLVTILLRNFAGEKEGTLPATKDKIYAGRFSSSDNFLKLS
ncbi:MAG TPA: hypothetical protein VJ765_03895 [Chitinophagaceae bacterium]|nr:hypothetical protein [Chitinophagaceae bacterium]